MTVVLLFIWVRIQGNFRLFMFRSEASGNCLYSSVPLALVGNNTLVEELRIMTSVELFLNAKFYSEHPIFLSLFKTHKDKLVSFNNLLPICSSYERSPSYCSPEELVRNEAVSNCQSRKWSSFFMHVSSFFGCFRKCYILLTRLRR